VGDGTPNQVWGGGGGCGAKKEQFKWEHLSSRVATNKNVSRLGRVYNVPDIVVRKCNKKFVHSLTF
jgi:hypothetical protein